MKIPKPLVNFVEVLVTRDVSDVVALGRAGMHNLLVIVWMDEGLVNGAVKASSRLIEWVTMRHKTLSLSAAALTALGRSC